MTKEGGNDAEITPIVTNLLPLSSLGSKARSAGVYVGEGLPPVPEKLAAKIWAWKFVDMAEMLPECWHEPAKDEESTSSSTPTVQPRRRKKVTDINVWLQCYALYTSVLATQDPEAIPELLAYLITILRVSQDFAGSAWVNYDSAFRRQADVTGDRKWSCINPSMYSIYFAGQARKVARCNICLSSQHSTKDCALSPDPDPDAATRLRTLESAVLALVRPTTQQPLPKNSTTSAGLTCRLWNAGRCTYRRCRYLHVCKGCGGDRPAFQCCEQALNLSQTSPKMFAGPTVGATGYLQQPPVPPPAYSQSRGPRGR